MRFITLKLIILLLLVTSIVSAFSEATNAADPDWIAAMREVHSKNNGEKGNLLQVGDSLTYSMAFFSPLQFSENATMEPATRKALNVVNSYMNQDCYRWKGPDKGNFSGKMTSWGARNIDRWIAELKPETVLIMFGSNDVLNDSIQDHEKNLRTLIQKCLEQGVVVILTTIPPMHAHEKQIKEIVNIQRNVAIDMKVPLIDFYAHIINRRPNDWDGTLPQFADFEQYETPTLIGQDGIHLSYPKQWHDNYTEEGLRHNGYVLRTWLTLMAYAEVINIVMKGQPPSTVSMSILGAAPPNH